MIDLTLFSLLFRLREGTAFGIKGGSVFFTVVSSLEHAAQTDCAVQLYGVYASVTFSLNHFT